LRRDIAKIAAQQNKIVCLLKFSARDLQAAQQFLVVARPNPSAIFAGTEELERRNCETIPYFSAPGNLAVNL
jgi:hypothetical protein